MPTLNILLPDGSTKSVPLPEGAQVTPDDVAQIVKGANLQTFNVTPQSATQFAPAAPPAAAEAAPAPAAAAPTPDAAADASISGAAKKSLAAIYRAIADRTIDPAMTLLNPNSTLTGRAGAFLQLASLSTAAPLLAAGAGVQAATEAAGFDPTVARGAGAATEISASLYDMARAAPKAIKAGRTLLSSLASKAQAGADVEEGLSSAQTLGRDVRDALRSHFRDLRANFAQQFNTLEQRIVKTIPAITPDNPAYGDLNSIITFADESAATLPSDAQELIKKIDAAIHPSDPNVPPQAVPTAMLLRLKKVLQSSAGSARGFDPDAAIAARKAAEVKALTEDVLHSAVRSTDSQLADTYQQVRKDFVTQLVDPERFVRKITARSTTPQQAFNAIFATNDPQAMQVIAAISSRTPALTQKLRMGFAESIKGVLDDTTTANAALTRINNFKNALVASQLFTPQEIRDLEFMVKSQKIPSLFSQLTSFSRMGQVLLRGFLGAELATHISSHPAALFAGAITFGAIPQLRRIMMLPEDSEAQRRAYAVLIQQIGKGLRTFGQRAPDMESVPPPSP
jgi:hypothetical protein